jgi:hypothetical protein
MFGVGRGQEVSARVETSLAAGIVVERPVYFTYRGSMGAATGGHTVVGVNAPRLTWYFAEGYTGPGFDEYLTILNPSSRDAAVRITYYLASGDPVVKALTAPAARRTTVAVHDLGRGVGRNREVSAKVEVTNGVGVVVERPMYFAYAGAITGGHDVLGAGQPQQTWYFAEGYTGAGFDEYLTILNPNDSPAPVTITYYLADGSTRASALTVAAKRRATVAVHATPGGVGRGQEVSAKVSTGHVGGIVVERPTYFAYGDGVTGGHTVLGATEPVELWYFAEGYTGPGFDEYLTVLNPNGADARVTITYYLGDGSRIGASLTAEAHARTTVAVHGETQGVGRNQAVSARVESPNGMGIIVERSVYFSYGSGVDGGHDVVGYAP